MGIQDESVENGVKPMKLGVWLLKAGLSRTDFKKILPHLKEGDDYYITPSNRYFVHKKKIEKTIKSIPWRETLN